MFVGLLQRERIQLGIALHVAVNVGFGLATMLTPVAPAEARVAQAPDPSPAVEGAVDKGLAKGTIVVVSRSVPARVQPVRRVRITAVPRDRGLDRFDLLAICESGGDPAAISSSGHYRGAFQFSTSTWQAAGGSGDPVDASYAEQKRVAMAWATVVNPSTQWPVCWPKTH